MTKTARKYGYVCVLFVVASVFGAGAAQAGPQEDYYRAYYLQREKGDLQQALELYEKVARSKQVDSATAAEAALQARCCREDLRCGNFAKLMPPEALAYLELRAPGKHLVRLLEQLGLTRDDGWKLPENIKQKMQRFAVSPALLKELSSFNGLAVAVTGFDPVKQMPSFVGVFHPGDNDVLRGLLETAIPAAGEPTNPIRGTRLFKIEGVYVAVTPRLVVVSQMRTEVGRVLKRLEDAKVASLADDEEFAGLQGDSQDRMLFACFNAKAAMPLIQTMVTVAGAASQEFQIASALLDLESLRWVVWRAGVSEDGLAETLLVRFDEDQNNLVYNLLRTPPLTRSALRCVPAGAAGFVAMALSEAGGEQAASQADKAETVRRITGLDLGREIFANIEEKALYLLPPGEKAPAGAGGLVMPDVGLVLTVRDPSRSAALWSQLLALPTLATGQPVPQGRTTKIAGTEVTVYEWPEGIRAYFASVDRHILIALTEHAMVESLRAARGGASVLDDEAFKPSLARLGQHSCKALFVHAGRCVQVARRVSGEDLAEVAPFEPLLRKLVASLVTDESNREFRLSAELTGIPEIGGTIEQLVAGQMQCGKQARDKRAVQKERDRSGHQAIAKSIEAEVKAAIREAKAQARAAKAEVRAAKVQARSVARGKRRVRGPDSSVSPSPPKPPPAPAAPAPPEVPQATAPPPAAAPETHDADALSSGGTGDPEDSRIGRQDGRRDEAVYQSLERNAMFGLAGALVPLLI